MAMANGDGNMAMPTAQPRPQPLKPSAARAGEPAGWPDGDSFRSAVRQVSARHRGCCVLDVATDNCTDFEYGRWSLVERDLREVSQEILRVTGVNSAAQDLAAASTERVMRQLANSVGELCIGVRSAFELRVELVNYKKVMLHLFNESTVLEKDLRQMSALLHVPLEPGAATPEEQGRYSALASAVMDCKGSRTVLQDGRVFTKTICTLNRHPDAPVGARLVGLPHTLVVGKRAAAFGQWAAKQQQQQQHAAAVPTPTPPFPSAKRCSQKVPQAQLAVQRAEARKNRAAMWRKKNAAAAEAAAVPEPKPEHDHEPQPEGFLGSGSAGSSISPSVVELLGSWRKLTSALTHCAEQESWPSYVRDWVERLLLARGAAKALAMSDALRMYVDALEDVPPQLAEAKLQLQKLVEEGTRVRMARSIAAAANEQLLSLGDEDKMLKVAVAARRQLKVLSGLSFAAEDHRKWLGVMLSRYEAAAAAGIERVAEPLFLAGDAPLSVSLPKEFAMAEQLNRTRALIAEHRGVAAAQIEAHGWPPRCTSSVVVHVRCDSGVTADTTGDTSAGNIAADEQQGGAGELAAGVQCAHCRLVFSSLWVHRSICYSCEASLRQEGRCPYGAVTHKKRQSSGGCKGLPCFCPHSQRCCACDEWSCEQCGLHRCDGEGVLALVQRLGAACCGIVFDWDRTLCTTKAGAAPLVGKHSLQPELAILLEQSATCTREARRGPPCCVATRNSHGAQIETFLAAKGVRGVPVNCVNAQGRTKADVALEIFDAHQIHDGAATDAVVVLVDDDLRELCDVCVDGVEKLAPTAAHGVRVHRVFFSQRDLG